MAGRLEDEDYWNDSETKNRAKAFNFEEDEFESQLCGVSKSGTARLSQQVRAGMAGDNEAFNSDSISGSFSRVNSSQGPQKTIKPLLSLMSEKSVNCILEAGKPQPWEARGLLPPSEELRMLRRQVEARWTAPDAADTIAKIFLGHPYSLELYRSLESKTALLDEAIRIGDGNAILIVVLFIVKTLNKNLVYKLLLARPDAVSQYVQYLTTRLLVHELTDLLEVLGHRRDAAMKQFQLAVKGTGNPERKLEKLKKCYTNHFSMLDSRDRTLVDNYVKLLEWQLSVWKSDPKVEPSVVGQSVLGSLAHACRHHWNEPRVGPNSPTVLCQQHGINDRLYQWTVLTVRASMHSWEDIESLFITKGWMGARKLRSAVPMERVVASLHSHGAPPAVLMKYLAHIDNTEKRVSLARKLECHKAVIDVFVSQRDRQAMIGYKANLHPQSEDYFYAENALRVSVITLPMDIPVAPPPTPSTVRRFNSLPEICPSDLTLVIVPSCKSELSVLRAKWMWFQWVETKKLLNCVYHKLLSLQGRIQ